MIPVPTPPKPANFDGEVLIPGEAWLAANPNATRPRPFWDKYRVELETAFSSLCGYAAMLDPTGGTVDHYFSFKNYPELTYDWENYRFASGTLNSSKKTADSDVLDPYDVQAGWFEITLPSLQLQVTKLVPSHLEEKAKYTIQRLGLRDGEKVIRWRKSWYDMHLKGKLLLPGLWDVAPLIAEAVVNFQAKNPGVALPAFSSPPKPVKKKRTKKATI